MRPWSLVSPASRGIGFAIARHLLRTTTAPLVATARMDLDKTKEELVAGLNGVDEERLTVLKVDVLDESTISAAAAHCTSHFPPTASPAHHLHLAFIIPGLLFPEKSPAQIDADDALLTFRTNTLGPMLMLKHFAPFLPRKSTPIDNSDADVLKGLPAIPTAAFMSARVGSITDNRLGGWYSYRASKAGLNQVVRTFDNHLRTASGEKAVAVGLHPGTVKTGLSRDFWGSTKKEKLFDRDWVAERLVEVVKGVRVEGRGKCWDWEGKEIPP
ncbi:short-chain dehydrogenase/reductase-like protein [Mytilinidion resinicola]|uniref:Short-chain dehydrogenase/reductase-like protein n=1 Tax=Mytilinidion resinicola TaxID=574789 RepID=A0A6A6YQQ5_9PEZI|nr:short-chain dehydrogenase/reductase-like protein [Mytilinidion resinicola]KAF2810315.1 short-chain dehydrogenase/reductase-like protein [Mytilinidion resinicola]